MAITMEEIAAIKELQAQGFGPYQISAQVGADPKTGKRQLQRRLYSLVLRGIIKEFWY